MVSRSKAGRRRRSSAPMEMAFHRPHSPFFRRARPRILSVSPGAGTAAGAMTYAISSGTLRAARWEGMHGREVAVVEGKVELLVGQQAAQARSANGGPDVLAVLAAIDEPGAVAADGQLVAVEPQFD